MVLPVEQSGLAQATLSVEKGKRDRIKEGLAGAGEWDRDMKRHSGGLPAMTISKDYTIGFQRQWLNSEQGQGEEKYNCSLRGSTVGPGSS